MTNLLTPGQTVYTVDHMSTTAEPRFGQTWEHAGHRLALKARTTEHGTSGWACEDLTVVSWRDAPTWAGEPPVSDQDAISFISDYALSESQLIASPGC